ncbi:hypothetical protein RR46_13950 [Papilio xuthus]|uniref:MD-2-related lipid-recognition domain-containing protein n=1 Tax=Papilio xuthus TaxID=66420 RepID=A0A194PJ32_PAPXU|nr:hypothetical protein RR46_13950 [Papilio xuthus]
MYKFILYGLLCVNVAAENYGLFTLKVTDLDTCKGPKRRDCSIITARMENGVNLFYDIDIKENVIPNRGKIVASANGKQLVRLQMKKPCDHLFMGPLFQSILNGHYAFNIDLEKVAQKYYGGMFLYGDMTFKSVFYSDDCNFSCTVVSVTFTPRNTTSHTNLGIS